MIEFRPAGDMFDVPADARVNTVNCVGVMGKGVAMAFKQRYPGMFSRYARECRMGRLKPGGLWTFKVADDLTVFNVATKDHWRDPSRYEWIERGLFHLRAAFDASDAKIITMPALGCGNGGLGWVSVRPMIERYLSGASQNLIVFEP